MLFVKFCLLLQFKSHKVYSMHHNPLSARIAFVQSVRADKDSLVFTTAGAHGFEAKRTCGQLHIADPSSLGCLASSIGIALKVQSLPSSMQFAITNLYKHKLEDLDAELQAINVQLAAGAFQLTFG